MATDHTKVEQFGGRGAEGYNALYKALHRCAVDDGHDANYGVYDYLRDMPRTSLTVEIVNKLREMGYDIIKVK